LDAKALLCLFHCDFYEYPDDVGNSKPPSKLADKRVLLIILVSVAIIIFAIWLFLSPVIFP
jgi:hypothetical protein